MHCTLTKQSTPLRLLARTLGTSPAYAWHACRCMQAGACKQRGVRQGLLNRVLSALMMMHRALHWLLRPCRLRQGSHLPPTRRRRQLAIALVRHTAWVRHCLEPCRRRQRTTTGTAVGWDKALLVRPGVDRGLTPLSARTPAFHYHHAGRALPAWLFAMEAPALQLHWSPCLTSTPNAWAGPHNNPMYSPYL